MSENMIKRVATAILAADEFSESMARAAIEATATPTDDEIDEIVRRMVPNAMEQGHIWDRARERCVEVMAALREFSQR